MLRRQKYHDRKKMLSTIIRCSFTRSHHAPTLSCRPLLSSIPTPTLTLHQVLVKRMQHLEPSCWISFQQRRLRPQHQQEHPRAHPRSAVLLQRLHLSSQQHLLVGCDGIRKPGGCCSGGWVGVSSSMMSSIDKVYKKVGFVYNQRFLPQSTLLGDSPSIYLR